MTERYNSFLVCLNKDLREDDAQCLITAISMLKGVLEVVPNVGYATDEYTYRSRMKAEIYKLINDFINKD